MNEMTRQLSLLLILLAGQMCYSDSLLLVAGKLIGTAGAVNGQKVVLSHNSKVCFKNYTFLNMRSTFFGGGTSSDQ